MWKERLYNKIRRKFLRRFTSPEYEVKLAEKLGDYLWATINESFGDEILVTSANNLVVIRGKYDEDTENVLCVFTADVLGKQGNVMVNESGDYLGIGRVVKKLLADRNFHVYYENIPLAVIQGKLAIGLESVMYLQQIAGNLYPDKTSDLEKKKDEIIH